MRRWHGVGAARRGADSGAAATAGNTFDYCLLCHGADANGNYGIRAPKLSGMEPWYLARQLENFAAGVRGAPAGDDVGPRDAPGGHAAQGGGRAADRGAVHRRAGIEKARRRRSRRCRAGQELYAACAACHGAKGEGNATLQSPALAARSDWYLVTQLKNFKRGLRGADERDT